MHKSYPKQYQKRENEKTEFAMKNLTSGFKKELRISQIVFRRMHIKGKALDLNLCSANFNINVLTTLMAKSILIEPNCSEVQSKVKQFRGLFVIALNNMNRYSKGAIHSELLLIVVKLPKESRTHY